MTVYGKRKKGMSPARSKFDEAALSEGLYTPDACQLCYLSPVLLHVLTLLQVVPKHTKSVTGPRYNTGALGRSNGDGIDSLANEILEDTPPRKTDKLDKSLTLGPEDPITKSAPLDKGRKIGACGQSFPISQLSGPSVPKRSKSQTSTSPHTSPRKPKGKITKRPHQRVHSQPLPTVVTNNSDPLAKQSSPFTTNVEIERTSTPFYKMSSSPDAAELSRKLTLLLPRDSKDVESPVESMTTGSPSKVANPKLTPLQKGKGVFQKMTRALSARKSLSSEEASSGWRSRLQNSTSRSILTELTGVGRSKQGTEVKNSVDLSNRRKAEGENLSKPKIKVLTGDTLQRPSLPIYESMRSKPLSSVSSDNLVSPGKATGKSPRGHRHTKSADTSGFLSKSDLALDTTVSQAPETPVKKPKPKGISKIEQDYRFASNITKKHRFSSSISGLRQHPNVLWFASPPEDSSMPNARVNERYNARGMKYLSTVPSAGPSLVSLHDDNQAHDVQAGDDASRESQTNGVSTHDGVHDDSADELGLDSTQPAEPGLTLKRKSGTPDLRSATPEPRKLRKVDANSASSPENSTLASGIADLTTSDNNNSALGPKEENKKLIRSRMSASKRNGLHIFDVGKGKERERLEDEYEEMDIQSKRKGRVWSTAAGLGPPLSRYNNMEWMASTPVLGTTHVDDDDDDDNDDSMSVDELQVSQYCV